MITVEARIELVRPFGPSVDHVYDMINTYKMKNLSSGTTKKDVLVVMSLETFEKFYQQNPRRGVWDAPEGAGHFISEIEVLRIIAD